MSLLSLSVESTLRSSFPADSTRLAIYSSLSCSHPEGRRLELFRSRCKARLAQSCGENPGHSVSGRKSADLVFRKSSALCSATWEKFEDVPRRKLEEMASGCFLSDFDKKTESDCHRDASLDSFRQLYSEGKRQRPFQSKVDNSLVYLQLRESLGSLDGPGYSNRGGSCIFNRGSEAPAASSMEMDRSIEIKGADSREEDVKVRPESLKKLKRKHSIAKEASYRKRQMLSADPAASAGLQNAEGFKERLAGVGDSIRNAFSSSVFMIKSLQSHLVELRKLVFCEDLHGVLRSMHSEMQESFLWLFQQVFSCTPKLMLLTMVLLVDFTAHSMGKHVALAEPPAASITVSNVDGTDISKAIESLSLENTSAGGIRVRLRDKELPLRLASDVGNGNGGRSSLHVGGGTTGQPSPEISSENRAMCPDDDTCGGEQSISSQDCNYQVECGAVVSGHSTISQGASAQREDPSIVIRRWKTDLASRLENSYRNTVLDQKTKNMLVAPVSAELQSDNYTCYDRTDLAYQDAISLDTSNPLLLANYAQFLYLVRHDNNRAEDLFRRAMRADPVDGEVMGRFASFLWIAKGDRAGADRAYRAALAADPTSSFHAGCYAHFLWNAGEEEEPCQMNARLA